MRNPRACGSLAQHSGVFVLMFLYGLMFWLMLVSRVETENSLGGSTTEANEITVQAMPRERLERSVVLNEMRELDRQQRIREGVLKQINRNPELKRAYDLLVKDLPEDQKETVIAQIGRTARRAVARVQPALRKRRPTTRLEFTLRLSEAIES